MLEVEPTSPPEVAETATKPPAPLQTHSLGGCTIDVPPVELPSGHIVSPRDSFSVTNCGS